MLVIRLVFVFVFVLLKAILYQPYPLWSLIMSLNNTMKLHTFIRVKWTANVRTLINLTNYSVYLKMCSSVVNILSRRPIFKKYQSIVHSLCTYAEHMHSRSRWKIFLASFNIPLCFTYSVTVTIAPAVHSVTAPFRNWSLMMQKIVYILCSTYITAYQNTWSSISIL